MGAQHSPLTWSPRHLKIPWPRPPVLGASNRPHCFFASVLLAQATRMTAIRCFWSVFCFRVDSRRDMVWLGDARQGREGPCGVSRGAPVAHGASPSRAQAPRGKSSAGCKRLRARACGCSATQHVGGGRGTCARPSRVAVHWAPPPAGTRQRERPANREGGERRLASRRARHRPATTRPTRCGRTCDVAPSPSVVFTSSVCLPCVCVCQGAVCVCVCVCSPSTAHTRPDTACEDKVSAADRLPRRIPGARPSDSARVRRPHAGGHRRC